MTNEEKLRQLDPSFQLLAFSFLSMLESDKELKEMGCTGFYVSETRRSLAVQMAYYSRGRMDVKDVRKMYSAAGLYVISDEEAKEKNTQTLDSMHVKGLALDVYPVMDGVIVWHTPEAISNRMGAIAEDAGLEWGGSWTGWKDPPHFQSK